MTNTCGRTWDFGGMPYMPMMYQWADRCEKLVEAQEKYGLSGLLESHHYGFFPSFISELNNSFFMDGENNSNAIDVVGITGKPEDVVLANTAAGQKIFILNNSEAMVANLVAEGGSRTYAYNSDFGGNIRIDTAGGVVSNCVIRNASCTSRYPRGIGIYLDSEAALVTQCVITNNYTSGRYDNENYGIGVHIKNGTIENSLVADNYSMYAGWGEGRELPTQKTVSTLPSKQILFASYKTIKLSKFVTKIIKQNLLFAFLIKLVVLELSVFGMAQMWMAVFADVGVSIIAIINALRMLKVKK